MASKASDKAWASVDFTVEGSFAKGSVVVNYVGETYKVVTLGRRYHSDVRSALYGVKPCKAPPAFAASQRMRALIDSIARTGTQEPGSRAGSPETQVECPQSDITSTWTDQEPGSYAQMPYLEVRGNVLRAVKPNYDDFPVMAWTVATPAEMQTVEKDMALAPQGVHLRVVSVRERNVEISGEDPRAAFAATIPGAEPTRYRSIYASQPGYAEALAAGAKPTFEGGPVNLPESGTGWRVPVTAWRAANQK